jgi:hypothetical protein
MYPWWQEEPQISAEVCQIMGRGDFRVYADTPHQCLHVMLGNEEWTSVPYPWGEAARETLRRRAWISHNGQSKAEALKQKEDYDRMMEASQKDEDNTMRDMAKSLVDWGYRDHDYYIVPGDK